MDEGGHQSSFSSAQTVPLTDDHTQRRYNASFCNLVNYYTASPIPFMYVQSYRPNSMVCRYVGLSVCHTSEPCKNGWTDRDAVWVEDAGGPREPCIRWGFRYINGAILCERSAIVSRGTVCRELCKNGCTDWFAVWIVDLGGPKESQVQLYSYRQVAPHGKAHWCHLANMIEPFVCSGDTVLCQITLTTCWIIISNYLCYTHPS